MPKFDPTPPSPPRWSLRDRILYALCIILVWTAVFFELR